VSSPTYIASPLRSTQYWGECWAHARREVFEAKDAEPSAVAEALDHIGAIYSIEADIRNKKLTGEKKRDYRLIHAKPRVELFFACPIGK